METIDPTKLLPEAFAADGQAPAPAPPEDGAALLDDLCDTLAAYVVFPSKAAAVTTALWITATHAQPAWRHATRLLIRSPLKRCGKSRLLDLVVELSYESMVTVNISPAALVRSIGDDPPTLCLDEADTIFRRRGGEVSESAEVIRGILNGGHQRNRPYIRWNHATRERETCHSFAMAALAGIGEWAPDTLVDRAIVIPMRRRGPGETVKPLRQKDLPALHRLRERLHSWARAQLPTLQAAEPSMPVEDRAADVWEPLCALADVAGDHWPETARVACKDFTKPAPTDAEDVASERLLEDLRDVFGQDEQLYTRTILDRLHAIEEAPWADWYGRLLRPRDLAKMLRGYGVRSMDIREHGTGPSGKGYKAEDLRDAWNRYLAPRKGVQ